MCVVWCLVEQICARLNLLLCASEGTLPRRDLWTKRHTVPTLLARREQYMEGDEEEEEEEEE